MVLIHRRASDKCQREKRKTINGDDLLWAMGTLGFEEYIEPLKLYLQLYREVIDQDLIFYESVVSMDLTSLVILILFCSLLFNFMNLFCREWDFTGGFRWRYHLTFQVNFTFLCF